MSAIDEAARAARAGQELLQASGDVIARRLNIVVDAGKPAAWRREPYYSYIKNMSRRALDGYELVVCIGDRRIVVFPTEEIDLGVLAPDRKLVSGYVERDGALTPFAMVLTDAD